MRTLLPLLLLLFPAAQAPNLITVTTTDIIVADDGLCSLPEAILAAESDTPSGEADGECMAGDGEDRIVLEADAEYVLTAVYAVTNSGPVGLPPVYTRVLIDGQGATVRREADAPPFRLFEVRGDEGAEPENQALLELANITLSGGDIPEGDLDTLLDYDPDPFQTGRGGAVVTGYGAVRLVNATLTNNTAEVTGGAVYNNRGYVLAVNTVFSGNTAANGGAFGAQHGNMLMEEVTFTENSAAYGGAVHLFDMEGTLNFVTLEDNIASRFGGGLYTDNSRVDLVSLMVVANTADYGGGAYLGGAESDIDVLFSRFEGNTATDDGTLGGGGAIQAFGALVLEGVTLSGNSAVTGGGVYGFLAEITLEGATITNNAASTTGGGLYLRGGSLSQNEAVVADNTAPDDSQITEG